MSEYDGQTYRPKYHEDLVHSEISLPPNAPKEYADRATLWNSVELSEKGQKSQLARMLKASLPNEWSYELAEEVVRDYVQRNFVDKGMCADWAIPDSENNKGQLIEVSRIKGTYAEPFTKRREDNAETVESRDTVLTIRVRQYRQGADQDRHRISLCRGNRL